MDDLDELVRVQIFYHCQYDLADSFIPKLLNSISYTFFRMTLKNKDILQLKQDEYIGDITDIEISSRMSVSTLYALETIFYLRLQLAQVSLEKNGPMIEALCRNRLEQLAEAHTEKYSTADSIDRKIEILERIEVIALILTGGHSDYALERASIMEDLPNLTYAQKLRLKWLPAITPEDDSKIVAELLPQTGSSFEMATLALISDFCTEEERAAIFDRYLEMFDAAFSSDNTAELGSLCLPWPPAGTILPPYAQRSPRPPTKPPQSGTSPSPRSASTKSPLISTQKLIFS